LPPVGSSALALWADVDLIGAKVDISPLEPKEYAHPQAGSDVQEFLFDQNFMAGLLLWQIRGEPEMQANKIMGTAVSIRR
jgi:hypothetical protein